MPDKLLNAEYRLYGESFQHCRLRKRVWRLPPLDELIQEKDYV